MEKYLVKLVFQVQVEDQTHEFDEQMRVIAARNAAEAFYKARSLGKREEAVFKSREEKNISWLFIDVVDIYGLEGAGDGEQLYSRSYQLPDEQSYIHYVKQKSMEIQVKNLIFA